MKFIVYSLLLTIFGCTTAPVSSPLTDLAHQLYLSAFRTSSGANANFDGGAPGQDDLASLMEESNRFALEPTLGRLQQIEIYAERARNAFPTFSPGYSSAVKASFAETLSILEKIKTILK